MKTRYECALIQNKLKKVPVVPVFIADMEISQQGTKFTPCNRGANITFPDVPHARNPSAQHAIDDLLYVYQQK